MSTWIGTSKEMDNRKDYYRATKIINSFTSQNNKFGDMKADLTNYILDGKLPEMDSKNAYGISYRSTNQENYIKNKLIPLGDYIMKKNDIVKQDETNKNQKNGNEGLH